MKTAAMLVIISLLAGILGCTPLLSDDINSLTSFSPYIDKDGKQRFRFVAKNKLPSYYKDADVRQTHESWIAYELGKRQYCTKGWQIVSVTSAPEDSLIYEGICK